MKKNKSGKTKEPKSNFIKDDWNKFKNYVKNKGLKNFIISVFLIILITGASLCLVFALYIIISAPSFDKELLYKKEATIIYDVNGNEFARIGEENRKTITYEDLPQVFVDALVATEDSRFFQHNGVDIARFLKASFYQLLGREGAGGASTLSMQLIKKTYTSDTAHGIKGIIRKFTDIYMSVFKLENCYTKEEILEFYANSLWFGNDGSINYSSISGVETASQYYFGKSVSELTLAEASILVGMYQNPITRNPYYYPENCRARQKTVLKLMYNHGYITEEEMENVLAIPIESLIKDYDDAIADNDNQAVIDYIIADVTEAAGKSPYSNPMKIYSTIDPKVQSVMLLAENGDLWKYYHNEEEFEEGEKVILDQEGIAVTSTVDGSIVALSGGRKYTAKGINRAVVKRQPGSTAKVFFDYAPYIEFLNGSTGDYFFDDKYTYSNGTPIRDADNTYMGQMTMRKALVESRNIPALQAFQAVMKEDNTLISDFVHKFHINYGDNLYESASIGGFDGISPLEMSAIYATMGRGGYYIEPYSFTKIELEDGTTIEHKYTKEKVVSEETAYMITSMLIDQVTSGHSGSFSIKGTNVAGKTGTTSIDADAFKKLNLHNDTVMDSWNVTYSPEFCIALWYGYDNLSHDYYMNTITGWKARSELMAKLAKNIYSTNKKFKKPAGVVSVTVEKNTIPLQLPSEFTPKDMRITELFKEGTEPTKISNRYQLLEAPTNLKGITTLTSVTLNWDPITTPKAIDKDYLLAYFNDNYGTFAQKYYEKRISENNSTFGELGYNVYQKNSDGSLKLLGWFSGTTYSQTIEPNTEYSFVVKAAYKNFKDNESSGINVTVKSESLPVEPPIDVPTEPEIDIPTEPQIEQDNDLD